MTLALAKKQIGFVKRMVRSGRFQTRSAVVREALRCLEREEQRAYLYPPPITVTEARRVYQRDAGWERTESALAGRARPE